MSNIASIAIKDRILSGLSSAASSVGSLASSTCTAIKAYRSPNETVVNMAKQYLKDVDLTKELKNAQPLVNRVSKSFFQSLASKQTSSLWKWVFGKAAEMKLPPITREQVEFAARKITDTKVINKTNASKVTGAALGAAGKMTEAISLIATQSTVEEIETGLLKVYGESCSFEEATRKTRQNVIDNISLLLELTKEKSDSFSFVERFFIWVAGCALKWFGVEALSSIYETLTDALNEVKTLPALRDKFNEYGELPLLKFLEKVTAQLINSERIGDVDSQWKEFVQESTPHALKIASLEPVTSEVLAYTSLPSILNKVLPMAASKAPTKHLSTHVLHGIKPSEILPSVVEGLQEVLKRATA